MIDVMNEFKKMSKQMEELSRAMIIDPFSDDFFEVFTRKRMELIRSIMNSEPRSIRELAQKVDRDIKNVFEDLKILQNVNMIHFEDCGKCRKPIVARRTIIFKLTSGNLGSLPNKKEADEQNE